MENFDLNRYKIILKETFSYFIKLCEAHDLRYYCAGGTALGAVRHHDFIPWDDDIDLLMPREDYCKLIELNALVGKDGFKTISVDNCNQYATFAKFYNTNTTLWEFKEIPFIYGIYIDIFPLDESDDSIESFMNKYMRLRYAQRFYQLSQMRFSLKDVLLYYKTNKRMFHKGLLSYFIPGLLSPYFRKCIQKCEASFKDKHGNYLVCPFGEYFKKEYFLKSWFEGYETFMFGDLKVRLPKDYDSYLSYVFGDYMKLPPLDKQVSHHYHYYLNMDKGMTLDDVCQALNHAK